MSTDDKYQYPYIYRTDADDEYQHPYIYRTDLIGLLESSDLSLENEIIPYHFNPNHSLEMNGLSFGLTK